MYVNIAQTLMPLKKIIQKDKNYTFYEIKDIYEMNSKNEVKESI